MGKENVTRAHNQMDQILKPESSNNADKRLVAFEEMEQYIDRLGQRIEKQHEVTSMEQRLEMLEKNKQPEQEIV
jgi:uncharacterized protein Yka (UPF0111/DUF47 family)